MHIKSRETRTVETITHAECDSCGRREETDWCPPRWHHFSRGHHDWGNDSIESVEYFDACSPECFLKIARLELDSYGDDEGTISVGEFSGSFLRKLLDLQHGEQPSGKS